jgi:hypothetical protein
MPTKKKIDEFFGLDKPSIWPNVNVRLLGLGVGLPVNPLDRLAHCLSALETGIRKFREKVREENGSQLIIFNKDRYAIFFVTG